MSDGVADALVVGGGIVGAACALSLAEAGLKVAVIEQGLEGGGATAAGMGHLVAMDDSEAQFALTRRSIELWNQLKLPPAVEKDPCGTLWVAADDEEMAEVRRKLAYYSARGVACEALDESALAQAEPRLRRPMAGALRVPGDAVIYPPAAAKWMLDRVRLRGGRVVRGRVARASGGEASLDDGSRWSAAKIVIACGVASAELAPDIVIKPRKGHLVITDRCPGFVRHQIVELGYLKSAHATEGESVAFNIQPRATGQALIGSSRQYGNTDPRVDPALLSRMIERAVHYMPAIGSLQAIRAWTGFRPSTPDKLPLIGPAAGDPATLLATGHEGLGITTAAATAELIRAHIVGGVFAIDPAPYLPTRKGPAHD